MKKNCFVVLILFVVFASSVLAQSLSQKQIRQIKDEIEKAKKEIVRLERKLKITKDKKTKGIIVDKIDMYRAKIKKLEVRLKPKPKPTIVPSREVPKYLLVTPEVVPEESPVTSEVMVSKKEWRFRHDGGVVFGVFSGATTFALEARFSLPYIWGPAITTARLSLGYAQSREMDRRYLPLNLDLIFKFPPGWFSGVENYLGAGLNYITLTTGRVSGTVGGQIFYGTESEGFGGIVFGEIGYGILRTGFSPSHRGVTVLIGYRRAFGY